MDAIKSVELVIGPAPSDLYESNNYLQHCDMLEYKLKPFRWTTLERCISMSAPKSYWDNWRKKYPIGPGVTRL